MKTIQVTFRDVPSSEALVEYIRKRASKLETIFDRMIRCHVLVESPHRHHLHGRPYHVGVRIGVPGREIVAGHAPDNDARYTDLYAAIDCAFDDAGRRLYDYSERLKGRRSSTVELRNAE